MLDWDTEFFGFPIGRAELASEPLEGAVAEARESGVVCLYLAVPGTRPDLATAAAAAGARIVDVRLELEAERAWQASGSGVRFATGEDAPRIEEQAARLSAVSRFRADPRFPAERVEEMYRVWARRCLRDGVVACVDGGGFVGARSTPEGAHVELVYVEPENAGRGLGAQLVEAAMHRLGDTRALVTTQAGNVAAVRLYEKLGFRARELSITLHLWLDAQSR